MKTLPDWLKKDIPDANLIKTKLNLIKDLNLHSVCQSAHCPNMGECFAKGALTFMILGDICTRNCLFCAVKKGKPQQLNLEEPLNIARAVKRLNLSYVVITSVTRDDLVDGGASVFAQTIIQVRKIKPDITIEVLIPDFQGKDTNIKTLIRAHPDVVGQNLETVRRLYPKVKPMADYEKSLEILKRIKQINNSIFTKSAILLGLGETWQEVVQAMSDLRRVDCDILTVGQYLSPSQEHLKVERYITPFEFEEYKEIGLSLGFKSVSSAPFVRSSYNARELLKGESTNDKA